MMNQGILDRTFSIGLWTWLLLVEKEANRLSENGQVALKLLREDLERLALEEGQ